MVLTSIFTTVAWVLRDALRAARQLRRTNFNLSVDQVLHFILVFIDIDVWRRYRLLSDLVNQR